MKYIYALILSFCGLTVFGQSYFQKTDNTPIDTRSAVPTTIVSSIAYQGYDEDQAFFGEGEYELFLDQVDGVLDKPIIILDGFDPGDTRTIDGIYNSLNFDGQNLGDILRSEGFDVVVLNAPQYTTDGNLIDGGSDYIQRNAMVLIELINFLNAEKVGDEELVVFGPSMGGLISRYALSYMEANSMPHETRLFISFDTPHKGANIPISIQYLINYLAEVLADETAQSIIEGVFNSPAAKEMLVDHIQAHLLDGSVEQDPTKLLPEGAPNFRDAFQEELDLLGFPELVRNVAMINGSRQGTTTGQPDMQIVDTTIEVAAGITTDINLRFTPLASATNTATDIETFLVGVPVSQYTTIAESFNFTDGVDSAPGGTSSFSDALGGGGNTNPIIVAFIEAIEQDAFSFIPTISSLAIENENDWFAIPDIGGIHNSPFVNTFIPQTNESHIQTTAENVEFALNEIRQTSLSINDEVSIERYKLVKNPVHKHIQISLNPSFNYPKVQVIGYNATGQKVLDAAYTHPSSQIVIHHDLTTGIYFLNIVDASGSSQLKLLVN